MWVTDSTLDQSAELGGWDTMMGSNYSRCPLANQWPYQEDGVTKDMATSLWSWGGRRSISQEGWGKGSSSEDEVCTHRAD